MLCSGSWVEHSYRNKERSGRMHSGAMSEQSVKSQRARTSERSHRAHHRGTNVHRSHF